MEINDSPNSSATLLWETSKAALRGGIISYSSYKNKKNKIYIEKELKSEKKIKEPEHTCSINPTGQLHRELQRTKRN